MQKLINVNNRNPCKLLSAAIIYNLVEGLTQKMFRALTIPATSGEVSCAPFPFVRRDHSEFVFTSLSLPGVGLISFLWLCQRNP